MHYLIKLSPEISIKSPSVKRRMIQMVKKSLQKKFQKISTDICLSGGWDRIEIHSPEEGDVLSVIEKIVQRTPGIAFTLKGKDIPNIAEVPISPCLIFPSAEEEGVGEGKEVMEMVANALFPFFEEEVEGKSFVVRIKRSGDHPFTSPEIERFIGGMFLKNIPNLRVNLHTPDVTVQGELKDMSLFIPFQKIPGMGGFPIQPTDRVLSLISGGYDSGVSTYLMMKKGCAVDFCFFNLGGNAHEVGVKQISYYLSQEFSPGYEGKIFTIPFEEVVKELIKNCPARYRGVLLKRMMLRVGERIAREKNHGGIVTGESLAQVSSQTLKNLTTIEEAVQIPVFRPLLTMEKGEIIALAEKIGTEVFSRTMPEYCGVVSEKPSTGAKIKDIAYVESSFPFHLLEEAFTNTKEEEVQSIEESVAGVGTVETVHERGENDEIIDIRIPEEQVKTPLKEPHIKVPFYNLKEYLPQLSPQKTYLLYCKKGVLSRLHALYLQQKSITAKIYRP